MTSRHNVHMPTTPGRVRATAYASAFVNALTALVGMLLIWFVTQPGPTAPPLFGITLGAALIAGCVSPPQSWPGCVRTRQPRMLGAASCSKAR